MTNKKIPDKNIYPDSVNNISELLVEKIDHLILTIKKQVRGSSQTSIGEDSGIGKNFIGRLVNKHKYTYFDCKSKNIEDFVISLNNKYSWIDLTPELFWDKTSAEEFKKKIAIKNSILPSYFYSGVPRMDYKFRGRDNEIDYLEKIIKNTSSYRINITGDACIGKTDLLIELARKVVGQIFDKVVWVTARKNFFSESDLITSPQHEIVLDSVLNAIIVQIDDAQDVHCLKFNEKLKKAACILAENKTLLIIDNFELVNDHKIHEFLINIPKNSKVIATSRDRISGFNNQYIERMSPDKVSEIIELICIAKNLQLNPQEKCDLEKSCGGNLVAVKWILGQVAALNLRLDLIIKNLHDDSGISILDHIFEFSFSKLNAHARIVLLTLANAPFDVTGNLIANSIVFNHSGEVDNLVHDSPDEVEKSLGLLVKFGLVSELKNDQGATDARISLSSKYRISLITVNYIKSKYKPLNSIFPKMLFIRFRYNLLKYNSNTKKDKADLIEFLMIWSNIAIVILNGLDLTDNYRELMRIYVLLKPFLGIVNTRPQRLPFSIFNVNAALYKTDTGQTFMEFVNGLLLIENKYRGRTGESFFIANTLHPLKVPLEFNDIFEKSEINPYDDNLDENGDYEEYIQIRATIIYNDEDIKEISHCNQFTYP